MTLSWHHGLLRLLCLAALALGIAFALASPAAARNVPGSAAVAQAEIDKAVGSSILDSLLSTKDAAMCENYLDRPEDSGRRTEPCTWGFAIGGGVRALQDAPDGYKFDYSAAYTTMIVTQRLSGNATVFGGLFGEAGAGVLEHNDGTLEHHGFGVAAGLSIDLSDSAKFAVVGSAEWLNYSTTRANGLYVGDYDAMRYMADARLSGTLEGDGFFVEYGGDLRFIHQRTSGYTEYSGGAPFADVPAVQFTTLTGIGNLKLGVPMGALTPYVEATGYLGLYDDSNLSTAGLDDGVTGRLGVGLNAEVLAGLLSLRSGAYFDGDSYKGFDAGFNFAKSF